MNRVRWMCAWCGCSFLARSMHIRKADGNVFCKRADRCVMRAVRRGRDSGSAWILWRAI